MSDKTPEHYDTNDRSRKGVRKLIIQKRVLSRDEYNAMIEELKMIGIGLIYGKIRRNLIRKDTPAIQTMIQISFLLLISMDF